MLNRKGEIEMPKIAVEIDLKEIEQIINQLKSPERINLLRRLERKTWGERFRSLVAQIDKRRKKHPISQRAINQLVKKARQERYASRS